MLESTLSKVLLLFIVLSLSFLIVVEGSVVEGVGSGNPGDLMTHSAGEVMFNMRLAPASTFPTGIDDDGEATVERDFWIAETQVTYELWYEVRVWAEDNGYTFISLGREGSHGDTGKFPSDRMNEPVTTVNWYDSILWCNALSEYKGYMPVYTVGGEVLRDATGIDHSDVVAEDRDGFRLPTSEEWELAARYKGSDSSHGAIEYPSGSGIYWTPGSYASGSTEDSSNRVAMQEAAWYFMNSGGSTQDVGSKPPSGNELGLFDLSGNVLEWCFSPISMYWQALRGGSWSHTDRGLRLGTVYSDDPISADENRGLRLVRNQI